METLTVCYQKLKLCHPEPMVDPLTHFFFLSHFKQSHQENTSSFLFFFFKKHKAGVKNRISRNVIKILHLLHRDIPEVPFPGNLGMEGGWGHLPTRNDKVLDTRRQKTQKHHKRCCLKFFQRQQLGSLYRHINCNRNIPCIYINSSIFSRKT